MELASPESLPSEDWISQPRSSAQTSLRGDTSLVEISSNASQSRIPLYTRSTSNPNRLGQKHPHIPSSPIINKQDPVLTEWTASAVNVTDQRRSSSARGETISSGSTNLRLTRPRTSTGSIQRGTVQHKKVEASLNGNEGPQATPDWKRRVLAGGDASGRRQDLFSPIGLQQVFKTRATLQHSPKSSSKKKPKYYQPAKIDEYPSSPPPYPSPMASSPAGATGTSLRSRGHSTKSITTEAVTNTSLIVPKNARPNTDAVSVPGGDTLSMDRSRVVSSESESRNESISIVQVTNGRINYEPTAKSGSLQRASSRKYASEEMDRPSSSASDNMVVYSHGSSNCRLAEDAFPELTSQSLPEGLSIDTEVFASKGGFINIRRGGLPMDDSFQKRPLSPSSFQPSEILALDSDAPFKERQVAPTEGQSLTDAVIPNHKSEGRKCPAPVITPIKPSQDEFGTPAPPRSSGSPLKLFDKYDTFTNDRLVRRLSQFEKNVPNSWNNSRAGQEELRTQSPSPYRPRPATQQRPGKTSKLQEKRLSSFGDGDLDRFDFTHSQIINDNSTRSMDVEHRDPKIVPPPEELAKGSQMHMKARVIPQAISEGVHCVSQKLSQSRKKENRRRSTEHNSSGSLGYYSQEDGSHQFSSASAESKTSVSQRTQGPLNMEGKRLLPSPIRDPNPKRRRTITDIVEPTSTGANIEVGMQSPKIQSIVGRKRKDARYEASSQVADPKVIANRPMLRPRTSTLSQLRTARLPAVSEDSVQVNVIPNKDFRKEQISTENSLPIVDAPVHALAGELAHFALDIAQDITYGNRKTSVTTADFTIAANLIMQNIRAQARPRSGRTSDENSAMDQLREIEASVTEGSTREEFSRPPSREGGGTLRRSRDVRQLDPRVISHLRRYEENDETGIALCSSLTSLKIVQENSLARSPTVESDPPNVRILNNVTSRVTEEDQELSWKESCRPQQQQSRRSPPSSGPSTKRSIPTSSSSSSCNKAVIVPENIPHLLSDHVGGMTFDRARQIWIRRKLSNSNQEVFGSDMTDDPLKEIPDLSVDELEEMKRVNLANHGSRITSNEKERIVSAMIDFDINSHRTPQGDTIPPTPPRVMPVAQNTAPSNHSDLASCAPKAEPLVTTLTGRGASEENGGSIKITSENGRNQKQNDQDDVEHEISILDGRSPETLKQSFQRYRQPRAVTVAFSSPFVEPVYHSRFQVCGMDGDTSEEGSDLDLGESPGRVMPTKQCSTSRRSLSGRGPLAGYRKQRRISMGSRDFIARPVSRIDEHEELSIMANPKLRRSRSMNIVLTTPQSLRNTPGTMTVPPPTSGMTSSLTFHLSPLSDFTLNQRDEHPRHDGCYGEKRQGTRSSSDADGLYAVTIRNLVAKITDVEPYEPYWEYIRKLDLQKKGLATLYMLDDFCTRIEELDVSGNKLGQLHGIPASLRVLKISHNCLSSLTAWAHLRNLQYLDVSCNQIQSLQGFQSLVHLRELKADDNEIGSLDGIAGLNGLLTLRLRNNSLKYLDFEGFDLQRLSELDVQGNQIVHVAGLEELPTIRKLNMRGNLITNIASNDTAVVASLRVLDISHNRMTAINMVSFPNLHTLQLDRNLVASVDGMTHSRQLTTLSWREQALQDSESCAIVQWDDFCDVSILRLSGNKLQTFTPRISFLTLQRLELAASGLKILIQDFGLLMPNLRFLNLNHNALKDMRPLLGLEKLIELHIAGNRISRLRQTAAVVRKLGSALTKLDCRGNPLTIGFYVSHCALQDTDKRVAVRKRSVSGESDDDLVEEAYEATYTVPRADQQADEQYRQSLDEDTGLKRRVYEMLVLSGCQVLQELDGLLVERRIVQKKDATWTRLLELGVLKERSDP